MIDVENLTFTYPGATAPAVRALSFDVRAGEIFGFLGPSGAGKSTTQKILIRLLHGFSGRAVVLGRDLRTWGHDLYERIGVSFEVPNLYARLSANENLRYFGSLYAGPLADPARLLEQVGLAADGDRLVSQYSKGMKNRLNVARALLHQPELLFLDEPTAGLDPVNARRIKALIRDQRAGGRTVFLTTHDMTLADELCDRIAFIVDGRISVIDAPRALKLAHGSREVRVEYETDAGEAVRDFPLAGLADDAAFLALLRTDRVRTLHTQEATLDRIFITVTGRSLE